MSDTKEAVTAKETKKVAKTAAKTQKAAADVQVPVLYAGPTLKGIATFGTVYTRIPEAVAKTKECPQLANLFIPVREYGAAVLQIRNQKGYIYEAYKEALKFKDNK